MSSGVDPISRSEGNVMTPTLIQALAGTKPWVQFCSIIGFIITGLMLLAGVGMMIAGGFMATTGDSPGMGAMGMAPLALMGVAYLVIAGFYFFPSLKLWRYGSQIASFIGSNSVTDLESALEAQRSFWKLAGILICVGIALYIVFMILIFAAAAGSAMLLPSPAP
ncbi:DUF5362 family protein [Haloferula sp. A504]|uniref:DUF5362 family protein n=1 Tax=Haloferula sp. A504 TaxID=3373601 RepID=UPI0031BF4FF4|nr:DUF5362 domain-containing protein [Verrucomicrobiaceae bacterium E54]